MKKGSALYSVNGWGNATVSFDRSGRLSSTCYVAQLEYPLFAPGGELGSPALEDHRREFVLTDSAGDLPEGKERYQNDKHHKCGQ
jgi:hypothetical protein